MQQKVLVVLLGALLAASACKKEAQQVSENQEIEQAAAEARLLTKHLMSNLKGRLLAEVREGGFAGAIQVCSQIGQEIPTQLADSTGHYIRRVSRGYRNPEDIPDQYERQKLEEFERLNQEQTLSDEYYEVVSEDGQAYLRYMKPLITEGLCLNCHGPAEQIPDEVKSIVARNYPDDRATGYRTGDVRGAVSVKIALE